MERFPLPSQNGGFGGQLKNLKYKPEQVIPQIKKKETLS